MKQSSIASPRISNFSQKRWFEPYQNIPTQPRPPAGAVEASRLVGDIVHPLPQKGQGQGSGASLGLSSIKSTPSSIAWASLKACPREVKEKYGKLLFDFCQYMEMCDNSGFRADGISMDCSCGSGKYGKNNWGKRHVSGPLLNRWHPKRRIAWLARMHQLADWYDANRITGCTMISLTGYQENSGLSFYDTWDEISASRKKLLKILNKYVGKIDYFWVVEPHTKHNTGYPHFHLVVFHDIDNNIKDSYGEGMEDKLRRLYSEKWETGSHTFGLDFKPMKGDDSIKNLKNYLMKYISKGYINDKPWSPGELIFNAHLYGATHGFREPKPEDVPGIKGNYPKKYRQIGMSRSLSDLLKPEEEKEKEQVVWLHVDETEPTEIKNDDGTMTQDEVVKVLYHRQLIPDWLDYSGSDRLEWGRSLARVSSWSARVLDEKERLRKEARRLRHRDTGF